MFGKKIQVKFEFGKKYDVYVTDEDGKSVMDDKINTSKEDGNIRIGEISKAAKKYFKDNNVKPGNINIIETTTKYTVRIYQEVDSENTKLKNIQNIRVDSEAAKDFIVKNLGKFTNVSGATCEVNVDTTIKSVAIIKIK